jgi:hypothetical protein
LENIEPISASKAFPEWRHLLTDQRRWQSLNECCYRKGRTSDRRSLLHGLGGIGKTQLAVEFAGRHHRKFSSVFWLDGSSEDSLRQSIARCASRISEGQISDTSRECSVGKDSDVNAVVAEVMGWLAQPDNTEWLVVFDNADREYSPQASDPLAYDVRRYFSMPTTGLS